MKAFIVQFPFGVAAFDEENSLVEKALFPKKPQAAAKSLLRSESGKLSDQTTSLITLLKNAGYDVFVFQNGKVAEEAQEKTQSHSRSSHTSPSGSAQFPHERSSSRIRLRS